MSAAHLGSTTSTRCPSSCTARASAVTTSPRPPTLATGAISTAMWHTCRRWEMEPAAGQQNACVGCAYRWFLKPSTHCALWRSQHRPQSRRKSTGSRMLRTNTNLQHAPCCALPRCALLYHVTMRTCSALDWQVVIEAAAVVVQALPTHDVAEHKVKLHCLLGHTEAYLCGMQHRQQHSKDMAVRTLSGQSSGCALHQAALPPWAR